MSKMKTTHVAYLHETVCQSIARDLGSAAIYLGLWSIGHWVGSPALEWVGIFTGFILIAARAIALVNGTVDKRMTPTQAHKWLDENFPRADGKETE